jgi:pyruvate dehydrogenase (quinone)/pyruvate oxidase
MPPKVSLEQARKFGESLLKGAPNRKAVIETVLGDRVRELV